MPWFYHVARAMVRVLLLTLTRWQVNGRENIPDEGPLLIVANHLSLADPPLISVSLTRQAIFMAKEELFRSKLSGYFIRNFGAFPVHRGQMDREALRQSEKVLAEGSALIIFPEATRSQNARLQYAFPGAALVARRSGVPILPVGITGTEAIKGSTWWLRRPRITVNIGQPFHLPTVNGKLSKAERSRLTGFIMEHIAGLLPPEYRGCYSESGEPDAGKD